MSLARCLGHLRETSYPSRKRSRFASTSCRWLLTGKPAAPRWTAPRAPSFLFLRGGTMAIGFLLLVLGASVAAGALWSRDHERVSPLPPTPTERQVLGTSPAPFVMPSQIQRALDAYKLLPTTRASGDAEPPSKHDRIDLDVAN